MKIPGGHKAPNGSCFTALLKCVRAFLGWKVKEIKDRPPPPQPPTHTPFPYLSVSGPKYLQEFQLQRKQISYLVLSVQHALKCSPWNQGNHDLEKC